jgi:radical SAM protein with 4Fe4S-binding SPASM domain
MCALYGEHREPWSAQVEDKELSTIEWLGVIDQLGTFGVKSICLTGGEPLVRKDLLDIVEHAKKQGLSVNILTSGSLISPDVARRMVDIGLDDISVSIDGPKEVHNAIRRREVFDAAILGIRSIQIEKRRRAINTPNVSIACTIQRLNQDHLHELVPIAKDLGVHLFYGPLFFMSKDMERRTQEMVGLTVDAKDEDQGVLDHYRCVDVDILYNELKRVSDVANAMGQEIRLPFMTKCEIERRYYDLEYSVLNKCFLPWYASRIDPFGTVYPCSINIYCGNIRRTAFQEVWNGSAYVKVRESLKKQRLLPVCIKCCALTSEHKIWNFLPCIGF